MITIVDRIKEFDYFNKGEKAGRSTVGSLITDRNFIDVTYPFRQVIGFQGKMGSYVKLDLMGNTEFTKAKELYWYNFSDVLLESMAGQLNFRIKIALNKSEGDKLIGYVQYSGADLDCRIAIMEVEKSIYLTIFYMDFPDLYRGAGRFMGKLYIHGIWEVELSGDLKTKLLR